MSGNIVTAARILSDGTLVFQQGAAARLRALTTKNTKGTKAIEAVRSHQLQIKAHMKDMKEHEGHEEEL
jgi:hypothetical protein